MQSVGTVCTYACTSRTATNTRAQYCPYLSTTVHLLDLVRRRLCGGVAAVAASAATSRLRPNSGWCQSVQKTECVRTAFQYSCCKARLLSDHFVASFLKFCLFMPEQRCVDLLLQNRVPINHRLSATYQKVSREETTTAANITTVPEKIILNKLISKTYPNDNGGWLAGSKEAVPRRMNSGRPAFRREGTHGCVVWRRSVAVQCI